MILLNTRPSEYRSHFANTFGGLGLPIIETPVLSAQHLSAWPDEPALYDAIIFTSPMAVTSRPPDNRWNDLPAYAVGPATAAAAYAAGFSHVRQTGHTAADLSTVLAQATFRRALYPSAYDVTVDLSQRFPGKVARLVTYRMADVHQLSAVAIAALQAHTNNFVPLFSRRSAENFARLLRPLKTRRAWLTALGISSQVLDITSRPWDDEVTAHAPTSPAMAAELADYLNIQRKAA